MDWRDLTWEQVNEHFQSNLALKKTQFNERYRQLFSSSPREGLFEQMVKLRCSRQPGTTETIIDLQSQLRELDIQSSQDVDNDERPRQKKKQCCILLIVFGVLMAIIIPIILHVSG